jgi:pyrimidine 5'-nucleotidase
MSEYMHERIGMKRAEIPAVRRRYYETYGTTLRGLQIHHRVDADDYLAYVHDLPLENFIGPAPELRQLLLTLPQQKWIFTNADSGHACRVLDILGLQDLFEGIVDVRAIQFACKPEAEAYDRAMKLAGEIDPHHCVMLDDSPRNLAPAHELGFFTILVGRAEPDPAADRSVRSLLELPETVPELWLDGR